MRFELDKAKGAAGFCLSNPPPLLLAPNYASLEVRLRDFFGILPNFISTDLPRGGHGAHCQEAVFAHWISGVFDPQEFPQRSENYHTQQRSRKGITVEPGI